MGIKNLCYKYQKGAIKTAKEQQKKHNIVLVGFMGSGKTVIGRNVARILDYQFADTDEYIRDVTGMDLIKLFRKHGEIRFRSEEKLAISKLIGKEKSVIACGGSLIPTQECLDMLAADGFIVLLSAAPDIIKSRLDRKSDRLMPGGRPNIKDINKMLQEREEVFRNVDHISVDTGIMDVDEAAKFIAEEYQKYLSAQ